MIQCALRLRMAQRLAIALRATPALPVVRLRQLVIQKAHAINSALYSSIIFGTMMKY